jgi:hypothetical protein
MCGSISSMYLRLAPGCSGCSFKGLRDTATINVSDNTPYYLGGALAIVAVAIAWHASSRGAKRAARAR